MRNLAHTKTEKMDSKESFEDGYEALITAIEEQFKMYEAALADLQRQEDGTVHVLKKTALQSAKAKLKDEYFGKTEKEFIKKMYKLPEAEFVTYLEKEALNKLNQRLQNYYEQKF